ncbi:MAG: response regulator [bacterium]
MTQKRRILWADDEIEMLRPHVLFLEERGYLVKTVTSGEDAVSSVARERFDAVLLDEQMAGLDGIATLKRVKRLRPALPVVMITKSEEESLMEEAIGRRIDDYLTKPVNPSQILSALKRLLETRVINQQHLAQEYVTEFNRINEELNEGLSWDDWLELHQRLSRWAIDLSADRNTELLSLLDQQLLEVNNRFHRYIEEEYPRWMKVDRDSRPPLSHDVVREWVAPLIARKEPVLLLVLDCLRLDHLLALEPMLQEDFDIETDLYFSILPTATPFSRNSIFSGLLPRDYPIVHPDLYGQLKWDDELNVNRFERQLLDRQLTKLGLQITPEPKYAKILDPEEANRVARRVSDYFDQPLVSMVFNFVDIVAHHRSTEEVIQTLIPDEAAYRSVVCSWFEHAPLRDILTAFGKRGVTIVLTTDHGSIRVKNPVRVIGDREASTNLRYKLGRNLKVDSKAAIKIKNPESWGIPSPTINTDLVIARENNFFIYPTGFHKFAEKFNDSFLHGGVSLDEMVLPVATLRWRNP